MFPLPLIPSREGRGNLTFYETITLNSHLKLLIFPVFCPHLLLINLATPNIGYFLNKIHLPRKLE
jgi:hypothetical protein